MTVNIRPAKLLPVKFTLGSLIAQDAGGNDYEYEATLTMANPVFYSSTYGANRNKYTLEHLNVGDYISTTGNGRIMKIKSITSSADTTASIRVVDEYNLNAAQDSTRDLTPWIETQNGIVFEVRDGRPILFPYTEYSTSIVGFVKDYGTEIISRFNYLRQDTLFDIYVHPNNETFAVGDLVTYKNGSYRLCGPSDLFIGTIVEINTPLTGHSRVKPNGSIIDIELSGTGPFYWLNPSDPGKLTETKPELPDRIAPAYFKINDKQAVYFEGAVITPGAANIVTIDTDQTITGEKTFSATTTFDGATDFNGDADFQNINVDGTATFSSFNLSNLTDNRIVISGANGVLEDDANLTFDGTTLDVGSGNFTVDQSSGDVYSQGNAEFEGNLDVTGNATIVGNLTVQGSTTTLSTTNTSFSDQLIELNDAGTGDSGIIINRTGNNNIFFGYDIDQNEFTIGDGTFTGTDSGNLTINRIAVHLGDTEVDSLQVTGNATISGSIDGHLIPNGDITYDLGSTTNRWRDLYVGPGSVYVDNRKVITNTQTGMNFITDDNENIFVKTSGTGITTITSEAEIVLDARQGGEVALRTDGGDFTFDDAGDTAMPGDLNVAGNATIGGNVQIDGTLTVDGISTLKGGADDNISIGDGDNTTDTVTFNSRVNSDILPDLTNAYDLGSFDQNWYKIYVNNIDSDVDWVNFDMLGGIKLPSGATSARPLSGPLYRGMIRFNTDDSQFEGYDGTNWGSLGGVKDVDGDTYIIAEDSPGTDNDELDFFTAGTSRMTIDSTGQITAAATYTPTNAQDLVTKDWVENSLSSTAGTPTDGTWQDGAYLGFTDADKVVDVLDELNESLENVRRGTFVRSVTFTASPTSGGEGTTVTLTLDVTGTANRYDITWGDGVVTTGTSDSTPSHTYTSNTNSPYTVTVRAYNNGAISGSAGSEASSTQTDYIVIYTADPVMAFALYDVSSGGTALVGNNLYVIEGNSLYMQNNTSNTAMADVTYTMDWGDGTTADSIASDSADGGVSGNRLQHTWGTGTNSGTGLDTLTLTLASHTTADPSTIPSSTTLGLKVYDPNITAPDGLSTKTISFTGTSGTSPLLAASATDNTSGTTYSAGSSVNRSIATSGSITSSTISTYAYNAGSGTLTALVNGNDDGNVTFDGTNNSGTYTSLVVTDERDYNLLNSSGSSISFNSSVYHPNLYTGFKARVAVDAASVPFGVNSLQLSHSSTGDTNTVEFVKDDLTSTPTITSGTLSEDTASYRYISGIPYYNTGATLTLSGITLDNFIGQTYRNTSNVVTVSSGTNRESTVSNSISTQNYSYSDIDGASTFLTGGIPNANTGNGTPYTIGDLTVNITGSAVRTVETLRLQAHNVNGTGLSVENGTIVQVHTAAQIGISEISISVSNSLGSTYTDNGVRIWDFAPATTNTPTFNSSTDFYTTNPYTENSDLGVQGTQEATIRLGELEHNVTDYSTGYLPVGPDRSGDTGTQYFTFAFRRTVVANFTINITSSTGVAGIWIAAPGTTIDNTSTLNGWLDCSAQYAGAGVPGADTGNGGNGSNGCAVTGSDIITSNTALSGGYTMTLGTENLTNAQGNVALVRIALDANQKITGLSIT